MVAKIEMHKTWFITGASSGFGMAFALYALDQGYNVVATARDTRKLAALLIKAPERVLVCKLDVMSASDAENAFKAAADRFKSIDVVVNNAGYAIVGAVEETPEFELRAQMETNFFGAVRVIIAALPYLRRQGHGAIVNMSSLGGQLSFGGFGAYSASKFALEGLSEALAQEIMAFGLKVLIVEPGAFRTSFAADALKHMPILDAYQEIVGGTRTFARNMHGTQEGEPYKAAMAIEKALNATTTPTRLQLGEDAVSAIRSHSEQLLSDMKTWEEIALSTSFSN